MVVWFALPGAVIDMAEDAESQFGILVEDFAVGHAILQMRGDEILVLQYLLDQRADLLVALDAGVRREDAMTLVGADAAEQDRGEWLHRHLPAA